MIKLYVSHHKPCSHVFNSNIIASIAVGTFANSTDISPEIKLKDNTLLNISEKNNTLCELTAQYWAWKNDNASEYIGFMHYRRIFDFSETKKRESRWGLIEDHSTKITDDVYSRYGLDDSSISLQISPYDIILPNLWDVRLAGKKNVRDQYITVDGFYSEQYDVLYSIIYDLFPDYFETFDIVSNGFYSYFTNMFVCRRYLLNDYCEWLFAICEEYERRTGSEPRIIAHLAERLLTVWFSKTIKDNPSLRVNHLSRVFFHNI
jgi:hypothetical protein